MYRDPTKEELRDPLWNKIWEEIKSWNINVPSKYSGYMEATGDHVCVIYDVVAEFIRARERVTSDSSGLLAQITKAIVAECDCAEGEAKSAAEGIMFLFQDAIHAREQTQHGPGTQDEIKHLADQIETLLATDQWVRELVETYTTALREVNHLQHSMAIELDAIPQQPRIEHWTRKMEQVICDALAQLVGDYAFHTERM